MLGPLEALIRLHELSTLNPDGPVSSHHDEEVERCKAELPPEIADRHEYLVGRFGTSAVAPIKSGCCSGCYVQIPSSRTNEIEDGLCACEQCGRLLYDEAKIYNYVNL